MLFRNGTHLIDAVCYFADADPVWLIAAHEQGFEDYGIEYKEKAGGILISIQHRRLSLSSPTGCAVS